MRKAPDQHASLDRQLLQAANDRDIASAQRLLKSGANIEAQGSARVHGVNHRSREWQYCDGQTLARERSQRRSERQ